MKSYLDFRTSLFFLLACVLVFSFGCSSDSKDSKSDSEENTVQIAKDGVFFEEEGSDQDSTGAIHGFEDGSESIHNVVQWDSDGKKSVLAKDASILSETDQILVIDKGACVQSCNEFKRYEIYKKGENSKPEYTKEPRFYSQNSKMYFEYPDAKYINDNYGQACPPSFLINNGDDNIILDTSQGCEDALSQDEECLSSENQSLEYCTVSQRIDLDWRMNKLLAYVKNSSGDSRVGQIDMDSEDEMQKQFDAFINDGSNGSVKDIGITTGGNLEGLDVKATKRGDKYNLLVTDHDNDADTCTIWTAESKDNDFSDVELNELVVVDDKFGYSCDTTRFARNDEVVLVYTELDGPSEPYKLDLYDLADDKVTTISKKALPFT